MIEDQLGWTCPRCGWRCDEGPQRTMDNVIDQGYATGRFVMQSLRAIWQRGGCGLVVRGPVREAWAPEDRSASLLPGEVMYHLDPHLVAESREHLDALLAEGQIDVAGRVIHPS